MPIPTNRTIDALATKPAEEERDLFINFMSALSTRLPEDGSFDSSKMLSHLWIHRQLEQGKRIGTRNLQSRDDRSPL